MREETGRSTSLLRARVVRATGAGNETRRQRRPTAHPSRESVAREARGVFVSGERGVRMEKCSARA